MSDASDSEKIGDPIGDPIVEKIVEIRDLAHGGAGVGRPPAAEGPGADGQDVDARVWFVEGALPGERVRAERRAEHKRWIRGRVLEVLEPSADRVAPPCGLADRCGGCNWQHVRAESQARLKAGIVDNQLRNLDLAPAKVVPSPESLGYRRRARVHYKRVDGGLELGFFAAGSHEIVDAPACPVLDPALNWAIQLVRGWAQWLPESGSVLGLSNGPQVVVGLPGVRPQAALEAAVRAVVEASAGPDHDGPQLLGVQLRGGRERVGYGQTWIELDGDGPTPPVSQGPFTFSQGQAAQNAALVRHVVEMSAASERRVLELHAGVGNFTRALSRVAKRVWTVDGDREAVANLQRLAERWSLAVNAKRGQAERLLSKLAAGGRRYDVVVCDPPRSGIGAAAARDLLEVASERVVYVSCDPATLARDLAVLLGPDAKGTKVFDLVDLSVFDMMPMTAEIEVVATLQRRAESKGRGAA